MTRKMSGLQAKVFAFLPGVGVHKGEYFMPAAFLGGNPSMTYIAYEVGLYNMVGRPLD